ncbi:efflux RND transporter periplasmic adaptor subunit [Sulfurihydrogenibium subterraneum]|uniref:efflux RND transporter periplasmic adaptor subunit n=1 Tax=Sulfurihydrogenibium subterraneum TaxID=171121 RepID=UPI000491D096|nr:efflux RND transporter periplasmic adaptor subunit [Sulfurihydrogenibium subterraneum]
MVKKLVILGIVLALLLTGLFFYKKNNSYQTYKVEKRQVVKSIYASGYIDTSDLVVVKSEVSGYVEKLYVKEGDTVKKGQPIAKISNQTIFENIKDIDYQISSIKEKLLENSAFQKENQAQIEIKKQVYENAKKIYERRKALFEKGLISKEQFDEVSKNLEVAEKDYKKQVEFYKDTIQDLNFQLKSLSAKKSSLEKELDKYIVKSPTDGKVLRKFLNVGDYVNSMTQSNQIVSIGNPNKIETVLLVDEEYIPKIKESMEVLIKLDSYPDKVFTGKIKTIDLQSDRNSRTVKVKADVNYDLPIVVNMTVEGNIILSKEEGIFIPKEFISEGKVKILQGSKVKEVAIQTESEDYNGYVKVLSGLKEGDTLVIGK